MTIGDISLGIIALAIVSALLLLAWRFRRTLLAPGNTVGARIDAFFAPAKTQELATVSRTFPERIRVDLQLALDKLVQSCTLHSFTGIHAPYAHQGIDFNTLFGSMPVELATAQFNE